MQMPKVPVIQAERVWRLDEIVVGSLPEQLLLAASFVGEWTVGGYAFVMLAEQNMQILVFLRQHGEISKCQIQLVSAICNFRQSFTFVDEPGARLINILRYISRCATKLIT